MRILNESLFLDQETNMEENIRPSLARISESVCELNKIVVEKTKDLVESELNTIVEKTKDLVESELNKIVAEKTRDLIERELNKIVAEKTRDLVEERNREAKSLNQTVSQLINEREQIGSLLRNTLSCKTNELFEGDENGGATEENEVYALAFALENIVKQSQTEIIELKHLVEELRAESSLYKERVNDQARELSEWKQRVEELEKERMANENVAGLMVDIAAAEEEIMRWRMVAQNEADAGKAVEQKEYAASDHHRHGRIIGRKSRTITATAENVIKRAEELIRPMHSPEGAPSISIQLFAEKIISSCTNKQGLNNAILFATARVIVLATSKISVAMDILIAELNRVCIYTVPKNIYYTEEAFRSKDAYLQTIGYREENGQMESIDDYVERLSSFMKLYGALVQTEIGGFQNLHGLKEGWAWFTRFVDDVPANLYTVIALQSFLEMAGFALYREYQNQFKMLLSGVSHHFLDALEEILLSSGSGSGSEWSKAMRVKRNIRNYIELNQFTKEPEGLQLIRHLTSHDAPSGVGPSG